ncbi:unnamed protein product [Arabis nemorensis]|uniref:Uncharacterized protein n=1 Tax=Arabis nemorensis TaxID=586526 RepID=A0A565B9I4_9BRAS|nr:unnamed protein product [Arabis nemorensis]
MSSFQIIFVSHTDRCQLTLGSFVQEFNSSRKLASTFQGLHPSEEPSAEVKMFQKTNNMANSSILQILAQEPKDKKDLHVLDIGVSLYAMAHCAGSSELLRIF